MGKYSEKFDEFVKKIQKKSLKTIKIVKNFSI